MGGYRGKWRGEGLGGAALRAGLGQYSAQSLEMQCQILLTGPQYPWGPLAQLAEHLTVPCERVIEMVWGFESCCKHNPWTQTLTLYSDLQAALRPRNLENPLRYRPKTQWRKHSKGG